jgi:hypothetical protein
VVKIGASGERQATIVMVMHRPDNLVGVANLELTLAEARQWLGGPPTGDRRRPSQNPRRN